MKPKYDFDRKRADRMLWIVFASAGAISIFITILLAEWLGAWIYVIATLVLVWVILVENSWLKVENISLSTSKVGTRVRVVQISDFHLNKMVLGQIINRLQDMELGQDDMIVLTGDIFDGYGRDQTAAKLLLESLSKFACQKFMIFGNHETVFPDFLRSAREWAQSVGIDVIDQQTVNFNTEIALSGLDFYEEEIPVRPIMGKFNLLITHSRDQAEACASGFDLVLCGHEHGGQVRLPGIGGIIEGCTNSLKQLFPDIQGRHTKGTYSVGTTTIHIDSGCGYTVLPLRLFNRVQISVITIEPI